MLTVHNGSQAKYYYDRFPNIMLSAFMRSMKEYEDMATSGVPWQNMIAYVGPTINSENEAIIKLLHTNGVRCMVSFAPTHVCWCNTLSVWLFRICWTRHSEPELSCNVNDICS